MKRNEIYSVLNEEFTEQGFIQCGKASWAICAKDNDSVFFVELLPNKMGLGAGVSFKKLEGGDIDIKSFSPKFFLSRYEGAFRGLSVSKDSTEAWRREIRKVLDDLSNFVQYGKAYIRKTISHWVFLDIDSCIAMREHIGLPKPDMLIYEYYLECLESVKRGGFISFPKEEYLKHKEYYDRCYENGCKIIECDDRVMICRG